MKIKIKDGMLHISHEGGVLLNGVKIIGENNTLETWPINSLYIAADNISPASKFGGTWEQIKGKFLLSSDDAHLLGSEGGEEYHTLTNAEMPNHNHGLDYVYSGSASSKWGGLPSGNQYGWILGTGFNGDGKPHNNMPPYLVVSIWKRVA